MLPDINTTIAAALYGVIAAAPLRQDAEVLPEEAPDEEQEHNPILPAPETVAPASELPQVMEDANPTHQNTALGAAKFLNRYTHGADPSNMDVDATATALADQLKDTDTAKLVKIPYRTLVLVFFSTKKALR